MLHGAPICRRQRSLRSPFRNPDRDAVWSPMDCLALFDNRFRSLAITKLTLDVPVGDFVGYTHIAYRHDTFSVLRRKQTLKLHVHVRCKDTAGTLLKSASLLYLKNNLINSWAHTEHSKRITRLQNSIPGFRI